MSPVYRKAGLTALSLTLLLYLAATAHAVAPGVRYTGRVLYRGTRTPVPGVLVEIVEAKDDGRPTDEVLGSTRAEPDGRFTVVLDKPTDEKVTLAVSAVRTSADSGGDRRQEGYQIKTVRVPLGFLPFPSANKPNTVLIDRRKPGAPSGGEDN